MGVSAVMGTGRFIFGGGEEEGSGGIGRRGGISEEERMLLEMTTGRE